MKKNDDEVPGSVSIRLCYFCGRPNSKEASIPLTTKKYHIWVHADCKAIYSKTIIVNKGKS